MKKYMFYLSLVGLVFFATSCDEDLEIEPEQDLSIDAAFADENTSTASLVGVYSRVQDLEVFGGMTQVINEYQADNVDFIGSFPTLQEINNYVTAADNGSIRTLWRDNYRAILAANAVIEFVPGVEDDAFTAEERAQLIAEAKFLRAAVYLQLVNMFAQPYTLDGGSSPGVPLVLEPFILQGEVVMPARNTVAEVYDQIETDLNEAIADLPESYGAPEFTRGRATVGAAEAMLARVHLYQEEFDQVLTFTDNIIKKADLYGLAPDFGFYDNNTQETILDIQMTAVDNSRTGTGGLAGYFMPAELGARGDAPYTESFLNSYEAGDLRLSSLSIVGENGMTYTTKYPDAINNTDNAPILRFTEILLNRAEALVKSTNSVNEEALGLINQLRERAGLDAFEAGDFANADEFLTAILDERRKELAFEGHRRIDLLRNGMPLRTEGPGAGSSSPGDPLIILPIPQNEIDLGSSLPQNPGY